MVNMPDTVASLVASFDEQASRDDEPLYLKVKRLIANQISSGKWSEGQRVPSEPELVVALNVSRMTINRALRELTKENVLLRQQGIGTFVAPRKTHSALFEVHNIADEIAQRGHQHRAELLSLETGVANDQQATELAIEVGDTVFRSSVLHFENELPVQLEQRVINAAVAPDYHLQDFVKHTAYEYLTQVAAMTEGEHLVEAVMPSQQQAEQLQISQQEPCLQIKRRTWSGKTVVATTKLLCPGSRFQLFGHFSS